MSLKARLLKSLLPLEPMEDHADPVASVVIAIGPDKSGADQILMTKRTATVETHKGQISFPGGYRETGDKNLLATALREAEEEVGLKSANLEIVGRLPSLHTYLGGILVCPFVAVTAFPFAYDLNVREVERLLYVPLERILKGDLKPMEVIVGSAKIQSIGMTVEGELIWGASARMLAELRDRLAKS